MAGSQNGMFYDPVHRMYHIFVQYKDQVVGGTGPEYWYHFASPNVAVGWRRVGVSTSRNVTGCSGGGFHRPRSRANANPGHLQWHYSDAIESFRSISYRLG